MSPPKVQPLRALSRNVADLARTEAFYRDGLGFSRDSEPAPAPEAMLQAMGLAGAAATRLVMRLGAQAIAFLAFDPPGPAYPPERLSTDPWFQHAAIVVRDMAAAHARLSRCGPGRITEGGPQTLPASSGGVAAFKFRDPDGHPLELIHFPGGPSALAWRDAPGLFLGIDHSAITVTDLDASLAFFEQELGLTVETRGLNHGPEQGRLDGLADPVVDVIGLKALGAGAPHLELLHYRAPPTRDAALRLDPRSRAITRLILAVDDLPGLIERLRATTSAPALTIAEDGSAAGVIGPDGHGMILVAA